MKRQRAVSYTHLDVYKRQIPYMDIPDAVTMDNKFHWNNLFTHHVLISKVTEISYSLAILFIALLFLSLSKAKITKTMAIKNLKFLGLSLTIGAGYKFFIWPFLDTMILHLDKVTIPILSNDPMFFLIGIGVYFGAVFAQKVNFELESFVSVSYTHLDVYKRQIIPSFAPKTAALSQPIREMK